MERLADIAIIGPGRVGTAIGVLAARAGWPVVAVGGGAPGAADAGDFPVTAEKRVIKLEQQVAADQETDILFSAQVP